MLSATKKDLQIKESPQGNTSAEVYNAERRFLIWIIHSLLSEFSSSSRHQINLEGINWNDCVKTAQKHGLAGFVYFVLEKHDLLNVVPSEVIFTLKKNANYCRKVMQENIRTYESLIKHFKAADVTSIPLKGVLFGLTIYKDTPFRVMSDCDVLVRSSDLPVAVGQMTEMQFQLESSDFPRRYAWQEKLIRQIPISSLISGSEGGRESFTNGSNSVDLHWDPHYFISNQIIPLHVEEMWERSIDIDTSLGVIRTLSETDHFFYTLCHCCNSDWPNFAQLLDLGLLLKKRSVDLNEIDKRILSLSKVHQRILRPVLGLLNSIQRHGAQIDKYSEEDLVLLNKYFRRQPTYDDISSLKGIRILSRLPGVRTKLIYIFGYLFPSSKYYEGTPVIFRLLRHWGFLVGAVFRVFNQKIKSRVM